MRETAGGCAAGVEWAEEGVVSDNGGVNMVECGTIEEGVVCGGWGGRDEDVINSGRGGSEEGVVRNGRGVAKEGVVICGRGKVNGIAGVLEDIGRGGWDCTEKRGDCDASERPEL